MTKTAAGLGSIGKIVRGAGRAMGPLMNIAFIGSMLAPLFSRRKPQQYQQPQYPKLPNDKQLQPQQYKFASTDSEGGKLMASRLMTKEAALEKLAENAEILDNLGDELMAYAEANYDPDLIKEAGYDPEEVVTVEDLIYDAGVLLKTAAELQANEVLENIKDEEEEEKENKGEEEKEKEKETPDDDTEKTASAEPILTKILAAKNK